MESLFNNRSLILRLKKGLHTPNPANPDVPMWTLEDLDQISAGCQYNIDSANRNLRVFHNGYQGVRFKNLARENPPPEITESVEVIDPKDFPTN
tara:strand:- start:570 stop:851 length:282 start_codon:yes stop_codon:yes gene_type:complete